MTLSEAIVKRINELCAEKQLSLYQLSYTSAVSKSTISNLMNGHTSNPKISTISNFCIGFNITLSEFFEPDYFNHLDDD